MKQIIPATAYKVNQSLKLNEMDKRNDPCKNITVINKRVIGLIIILIKREFNKFLLLGKQPLDSLLSTMANLGYKKLIVSSKFT